MAVVQDVVKSAAVTHHSIAPQSEPAPFNNQRPVARTKLGIRAQMAATSAAVATARLFTGCLPFPWTMRGPIAAATELSGVHASNGHEIQNSLITGASTSAASSG